MTWDVFIFAAPATARTLDEIPLDFDPPPHGPAEDVRNRLTAAFPSLDLSDPARGILTDGRWTINLNIGRDDPVHAITLHARGDGADLLPVIANIAESVGGRAMDIATGEFLTDVTRS